MGSAHNLHLPSKRHEDFGRLRPFLCTQHGHHGFPIAGVEFQQVRIHREEKCWTGVLVRPQHTFSSQSANVQNSGPLQVHLCCSRSMCFRRALHREGLCQSLAVLGAA